MQSPHIGRERPEIKSGYRSLAEGKHVIFYRVGDGGIDILRILHGRMDIEHRMGQTRTGSVNMVETVTADSLCVSNMSFPKLV